MTTKDWSFLESWLRVLQRKPLRVVFHERITDHAFKAFTGTLEITPVMPQDDGDYERIWQKQCEAMEFLALLAPLDRTAWLDVVKMITAPLYSVVDWRVTPISDPVKVMYHIKIDKDDLMKPTGLTGEEFVQKWRDGLLSDTDKEDEEEERWAGELMTRLLAPFMLSERSPEYQEAYGELIKQTPAATETLTNPIVFDIRLSLQYHLTPCINAIIAGNSNSSMFTVDSWCPCNQETKMSKKSSWSFLAHWLPALVHRPTRVVFPESVPDHALKSFTGALEITPAMTHDEPNYLQIWQEQCEGMELLAMLARVDQAAAMEVIRMITLVDHSEMDWRGTPIEKELALKYHIKIHQDDVLSRRPEPQPFFAVHVYKGTVNSKEAEELLAEDAWPGDDTPREQPLQIAQVETGVMIAPTPEVDFFCDDEEEGYDEDLSWLHFSWIESNRGVLDDTCLLRVVDDEPSKPTVDVLFPGYGVCPISRSNAKISLDSSLSKSADDDLSTGSFVPSIPAQVVSHLRISLDPDDEEEMDGLVPFVELFGECLSTLSIRSKFWPMIDDANIHSIARACPILEELALDGVMLSSLEVIIDLFEVDKCEMNSLKLNNLCVAQTGDKTRLMAVISNPNSTFSLSLRRLTLDFSELQVETIAVIMVMLQVNKTLQYADIGVPPAFLSEVESIMEPHHNEIIQGIKSYLLAERHASRFRFERTKCPQPHGQYGHRSDL
ncbi:hypothetical protein Poli38472_001300 [Pythium oligandrum]|uniref:Uncharacterized protein n=1 Tax=Pythium oligandrum TaxID=41045 RepID=A0A8K1CT90_PYTOL|nr:hypothetical protein Poli38472_001300 [Pythium oligandrum]|eukprot:TMW69144.1 hypothetical protein Poli38472_001300 [Pythium oligandrum]